MVPVNGRLALVCVRRVTAWRTAVNAHARASVVSLVLVEDAVILWMEAVPVWVILGVKLVRKHAPENVPKMENAIKRLANVNVLALISARSVSTGRAQIIAMVRVSVI